MPSYGLACHVHYHHVHQEHHASVEDAHLGGGALLNGRDIGRTKTLAGVDVGLSNKFLLVPLQALHVAVVVSEPGLVDASLGVILHLFGNLDDISGGREVGLTRLEADFLEGVLGEEALCVTDDQDSSTFGIGSRCSAQSVDVALLVGGHTNLNDGGHTREIHSTSDNICSDQDGAASGSVVVCDLGTLVLRHAAVKDRNRRKSGQSLEKLTVEVCNGGSGCKENGLESLAAGGLFTNTADHGGCNISKGGHLDEELGNALMGVGFTSRNGRDKLVARSQNKTSNLLDVRRDGGGEKHALAVRLGLVGKTIDNFAEILHETHIEKTISLIEDKGVKVAHAVNDIAVGHVIQKATRCSDENFTAAEDIPLLAVLVCSSNSDLDAVLGESLKDLGGLSGNLKSQLTSRRDDEQGNAVTSSAVLVDHGLQSGDKESHSLSCSCSSLNKAVVSVGREKLIHSRGLNRRHELKLHILCDSADDNRMNLVVLGETVETTRVKSFRRRLRSLLLDNWR
ncbi:hypothetical protein HG530_015055 [Fusarium avenaceum]|nr:hypothetical protein HG530_015055 [Fusarium avenaceum]